MCTKIKIDIADEPILLLNNNFYEHFVGQCRLVQCLFNSVFTTLKNIFSIFSIRLNPSNRQRSYLIPDTLQQSQQLLPRLYPTISFNIIP